MEKKTEKIIREQKNSDGDIHIVGKTDSATDFKFHNVVDGDTLSDIVISGNATFEIRNRWIRQNLKSESVTAVDNMNMVAKLARKAVSQSTIKKAAALVKNDSKNINEKGFTTAAWTSWLIGFIVVACLVWLYFYFGGRINNSGRF